MTKSFTFQRNLPFVGNRPLADVKLVNNNLSSATYKCLVDTGADYLQLPAHAASSINISLIGHPVVPISTASGSTNMVLYRGVDLEIEGKFIANHPVLFDITNTMNVLCGRYLLLTAFDIGFDLNDWHHTWP